MEVAGWFVGPIMEKIINTCSDYLKDQIRWQTGMKEELERLRQNHPKIQAVVFAANQAQISDQNTGLNEWIWQLRDALDEVNDVLDELEYMKHKEQLTKNMEETEERTAFSNVSFLVDGLRIAGERALKNDPRLNRLEEVVQKLDNVSTGVSNFLPLLDIAKQGQQEQQRQLSEARESGCLPTTNDLIGRSKDMESVKQWLRKPSNEPLTKCPNLISLGRYREVETTNNFHLILDYLCISDPSVLLMEPLRSIASLKWLCVTDNDEVVSFSNEEQWFLKVRSSLSDLKFSDLKSLESLPSSLESLSSLKELYINDVPMLRELPNLPLSLKRLTIWRCHPELKERYGEDGGSDRHNIAHIPEIYIPT